jgi:hypothetical protein
MIEHEEAEVDDQPISSAMVMNSAGDGRPSLG